MTDYAAEYDRILAEFRAGSRGVQEQFLEADARTARGGAELFAQLREQLRSDETPPGEDEAEAAARDEQAERERLLRDIAERAKLTGAERPSTGGSGKHAVVLPTDWTDEDEARAEGYGPPDSWLR